MDLEIISFNISRELIFTDEVVKALGLPTREASWHPLNIPVETLDPAFEYRWKAYAVAERFLHEDTIAQSQIIDRLQIAVIDGWRPVESLQYPHLLTPRIRQFSNGKFIRFNGLMLFCRLKQLTLEDQSMGGINVSKPLSTGKQISSTSFLSLGFK